MKTIRLSVLCTLAAVGAASRALAVDATFNPSADTTIFSNNPSFSAGGGNGLVAGDAQGTPVPPRRGLVLFDLSSIPSNAVVQSAKLTMVMGMAAGGGTTPQTIELHRLSASWGEGTVLTQSPASDSLGGQGQGLAANPGDATWSHRFFNTTAWTNAGGDFNGAITASRNDVIGTAGASYDFTGANLSADVQGWIANSATNFGWLIKNADESTAQNFRAFFSRNTLTPANRPVLSVTYVPEPASLALVATVAAVAVARRAQRRRI